MRRITIRRARTWHYRKMRPCIEQSNGPVSLSPSQSWPDCIINMFGYDFRKGQEGLGARRKASRGLDSSIGGLTMSKAIPKECMALLKEASEMFSETGCVPGIDGEEVPAERI